MERHTLYQLLLDLDVGLLGSEVKLCRVLYPRWRHSLTSLCTSINILSGPLYFSHCEQVLSMAVTKQVFFLISYLFTF